MVRERDFAAFLLAPCLPYYLVSIPFLAKMFALSILALAASAIASDLERRAPTGVPSYVTQYAPIVYLFSGDPYRPSDIGAQLTNTQPDLNSTPITNGPSPLTLNNLNDLNNLGGSNVYLTSKTDVTTNPAYLKGVTPDAIGKTNGAVSCAIVVNDHGNGNVDAFYFYFYAFNFGGVYVGLTIGDHVGDWEHNMIRFANGNPTAIWYSQHSNGEAFTYGAAQKYNGGVRVRAHPLAAGEPSTYKVVARRVQCKRLAR